MFIPAHVRLTVSSGDVPGQLFLSCDLVDDAGDVLEQNDPTPLSTGQVLTYGPVRVEASISSTFTGGGSHGPGGTGGRPGGTQHPPGSGSTKQNPKPPGQK